MGTRDWRKKCPQVEGLEERTTPSTHPFSTSSGPLRVALIPDGPRTTAQRTPAGVKIFPNLVYQASGGRQQRLDVYEPPGSPPPPGWPTVIAIHGGGWRRFDKGSYGRAVASLTRHGFAVVAVDYQLSSPGSPSWPGNFDDVREAVRWVRLHAPDFGIDPDRIAALGESSGGHLAALLGTYPETSAGTSARVQAVVTFAGPTDLEALGRDSRQGAGLAVTQYLGGSFDQVPDHYRAASPIQHVSGDDPPTLLIHGSADLLVPLSQSQALAQALAAAGVPHRLIIIPGAVHASHGPRFQLGDRSLLPQVVAFLNANLVH